MKKNQPKLQGEEPFNALTDTDFIHSQASIRIPANDSGSEIFQSQTFVNNPYTKSKTAHNKMLVRRRKRSQHPLRELRLKRGFTLEELAELTALSPSYLSRLESGSRRLNADILQRIATILACHPGDLLPTEQFSYKYPQSSWTHTDLELENQNITNPLSFKDLPFQVLIEEDARFQRYRLSLDDTIEWVTRPAQLHNATGAFAFKVSAPCCGNRYGVNDFVFADPSQPLTADCYMIAISHSGQAFVGQFKKWSASDGTDFPDTLMMSLANANQPTENQTITLKKSEIKVSYRIVGTSEVA